MSNFNCEKCGTPITEDENGYYPDGCEHYPPDLALQQVAKRVEDMSEKDWEEYFVGVN